MVPDQAAGTESTDSVPAIPSALTPDRVQGLACILVGASLVVLTFLTLDLPRQTYSLLVMGGAGWMLVAIGEQLLRDRERFGVWWSDSEQARWFGAAVWLGQSLLVVIAVVLVVWS